MHCRLCTTNGSRISSIDGYHGEGNLARAGKRKREGRSQHGTLRQRTIDAYFHTRVKAEAEDLEAIAAERRRQSDVDVGMRDMEPD